MILEGAVYCELRYNVRIMVFINIYDHGGNAVVTFYFDSNSLNFKVKFFHRSELSLINYDKRQIRITCNSVYIKVN